MELIDKSALVAEIEKAANEPAPSHDQQCPWEDGYYCGLYKAENIIDTLKVKDLYEQCVQYSSIKDGIEAHASIYSFNIESQLFPQLTKEQQALWRKEIEQACISGGDAGVTLARDQRYKENLEVKEVDLEKEIKEIKHNYKVDDNRHTSICSADIEWLAKHFFELGLKAKGE